MKLVRKVEHVFNGVLCLLLAALTACMSATGGKYDAAQPAPAAGALHPSQPVPSVKPSRARMPWEVWPYDRDLGGQLLTNAALLQGDQYLKAGLLEKALSEYEKAQRPGLSEREREALVLRMSSVQLALDRPALALGIVSDYFRVRRQTVEDVDPHFSLLLAYGYGRKHDFNQSLAWFSRVNRISGGQGPLSDAAQNGTRLLLRSVPADQFPMIRRQWTTDTFIAGLLGQEHARRAAGEPVPTPAAEQTPRQGAFWRPVEPGPAAGASGGGADGAPAALQKIVALLPLTGQLGALGQSTKNGAELALAGLPAGSAGIEYKDSGGDPAQIETLMLEIEGGDSGSVILGPLLSEAAIVAADAARRARIPMLSLSKQDSFLTGEGVFRLGATAASQVASLLEACSKHLSLTRYALVYPESSNGRLFADTFRAQAGQRRLELVYEASYFEGDYNGLSAIAAAVQEKGVQGVFMPDSLTAAASLFANIPEETRRNIRLLGTASWDEIGKLSHSATLLEGAVFVSPFFSESGRAEIMDFMRAYQSRYNKAPDFLAAQGFDAATLLLTALRRRAAERLSFEEAFQKIEVYDGLTGVMSIEPGGEVRRRFAVVQFSQGRRTALDEAPPQGSSDRAVLPGEQKGF